MLWGGRFHEKINNDAMEFSSSLPFDIQLIHEDINVSKAHVEMLAKVNLIEEEEAKKIINGLNFIEAEYDAGTWKPDPEIYEDIHSAVEERLFEVIGVAAKKLHTGRSRNDQVAADLRLWVKKSAESINNKINSFQKNLLDLAEKNIETIIPGYTHLQRAQPVSLAFHLLAYIEMLERDKKRFDFVFNESNISPLGSGALAGSTLPLDNDFSAEKLKFSSSTSNALDAVSDRDFVLDFLNACSIGMMHLSRFAEEIILWSSSEWKLIKIGERYTTGSSLMPQKKNPDMAELIRGKAGRVYGNYLSLAVTLKSLPLSYNRDLQEDKEPLFDSYKTYSNSLNIFSKMIETIQINKKRFEEELEGDFFLSTDLADWLVLQGVPFRESHKIVGEVVKYAESKNKNFSKISLEELRKINPIFDESALDSIKLKDSLFRKKTKGSPNPDYIKTEIIKWKGIINLKSNETVHTK